jgi:hypothetical protein
MKTSLLFPLALSIASSVDAWTFMWHDAQNRSHIETGVGEVECTEMNMVRGMRYTWDPESSPYCINMFRNSDCTERNGLSCPRWGPRLLGQDFVRGWQVTRMADPASTSSTSSSSTSTPTPSSTTVPPPVTVTAEPTETPTPTPDPAPKSKSLSGGAIAGVVIGVLAGAAAIVICGLLFLRRQRDNRDPDGAGEKGSHDDDKYPVSRDEQQHPAKERSQELDSQPTSPVAPPAFGAISPQVSGQTEFTAEKGNIFSAKYGNARPHIPELPDNSQIAELEDSPVK